MIAVAIEPKRKRPGRWDRAAAPRRGGPDLQIESDEETGTSSMGWASPRGDRRPHAARSVDASVGRPQVAYRDDPQGASGRGAPSAKPAAGTVRPRGDQRGARAERASSSRTRSGRVIPRSSSAPPSGDGGPRERRQGQPPDGRHRGRAVDGSYHVDSSGWPSKSPARWRQGGAEANPVLLEPVMGCGAREFWAT